MRGLPIARIVAFTKWVWRREHLETVPATCAVHATPSLTTFIPWLLTSETLPNVEIPANEGIPDASFWRGLLKREALPGAAFVGDESPTRLGFMRLLVQRETLPLLEREVPRHATFTRSFFATESLSEVGPISSREHLKNGNP
ncbi:MAG: hypothetical protein HY706_20385 [Candidatus Hydrogenedentes bacterium]|nr:hypothetical protein [Candidatus Hydrogenedentota bacterium]